MRLPLFIHRFFRLILPVVANRKGGWRLRAWVMDVRKTRFLRNALLQRLETGASLWIDPNDSMGRSVFYHGLWEGTLARHFYSCCHLDDIVLDVGANFGQYSVLAAQRVGARGRVVAVEVNSRCLSLLKKNLFRCEPVRMDLLAVAAWSENTTLNLLNGSDSTTGLASVRTKQDSGNAEEVVARRLDDALAEINCPHVDVIKLDIEGAELPALQGLSRLLEQSPPRAIYCEVEDVHCVIFGYCAADLFAFLDRFGYRAYGFRRSDGVKERCQSEMDIATYANMFYFEYGGYCV